MDRIFKISTAIVIPEGKTGKKGQYKLGQLIESKNDTGTYTERFYEGLSQEEAITQVLKSNGVDVSSETFLKGLLELAEKGGSFADLNEYYQSGKRITNEDVL